VPITALTGSGRRAAAGGRVIIGLFVRAAVGAALAFVFIMAMAAFIPSHG
jgi:hypothetical protein